MLQFLHLQGKELIVITPALGMRAISGSPVPMVTRAGKLDEPLAMAQETA